MRKLVIKTAFITLGVTLLLALAVFGTVSLLAPATMMRLSLSLGLERIGADYAYQEYERSGEAEYLARAFEICAAEGYDDKTAEQRFELLCAQDPETFAAMCERRTEEIAAQGGVYAQYDYRDYVMGLGACVKYRLAAESNDAEGYADAIGLALSETAAEFPAGNPVIALAVEAAGARDAAFCGQLLAQIGAAGFEETADYLNIVTILEEIANE